MVQFGLISAASAQGAPAANAGAAGFDFLGLLPFALIFVVMYFLVMRPQQKKMKQHADMIASLRRGDKVVTSGGLIGSISKLTGSEELTVEIAENVNVRILKSSITQVLAKTAPITASTQEEELTSLPEDIQDTGASVEKKPAQGPKKVVKSAIRTKKPTTKK